MQIAISKKLTKEQKLVYENQYKGSKLFRETLCKVLEDKVRESQDAMLKTSNYESSSWDRYQADRIGQIKALKDILKYLE